MDNKNFWNDVAKWGVLIGIIMGSSRVLEYGMMLSADMTTYALLTFEYVIVAVVYGVLLYRATLTRAVAVYEQMGFSFGRTLNYAMLISIFASVIVAAMSYVYINSFVGSYTIYLDRLIESITAVMNEAQVDRSVVEMYLGALDDVQGAEQVEPTIFTTLMSSVSTYIMSGVGVGIIVSFLVKRYLKKNFSNKEEVDNEAVRNNETDNNEQGE